LEFVRDIYDRLRKSCCVVAWNRIDPVVFRGGGEQRKEPEVRVWVVDEGYEVLTYPQSGFV